MTTQPLAEQGGGHQRDSPLDVVEAAAPGERQLTDDQRRPTLGEHLGGLCEWAELSVALHGQKSTLAAAAINCRFCS